MNDWDDVIGVPDSRGKLIQGLIESIELFNKFEKVIKSTPELKDKFQNSIKSINESIEMIKSMDGEDFTNLVYNREC
jgi:hypothetical protein